MKLTQKQLQEFIQKQAKKLVEKKQLKEAVDYKDIFPGADGEFISYLEDIDKLIDDTVDEAEKLRQKGKDMIANDLLNSSEVAERNRFIEARTSFLQQLIGQLVQHKEKMRRDG